MFARNVLKNCGESNSGALHPEHQIRNTRVSEYLRKYGQGKIDSMPETHLPEVTDSRTVEQMLDEPVEHPALDPVEVLAKLQEMLPKWNDAREQIAQTEKDKKVFDDAVAVLNDVHSTDDQKYLAYQAIVELENQGKAKRTRARK